ncbi:PAS domain-containing protein [Mesorhizobium sp. IMUNJ 23232]|uniref:PAS domain-containing protein n=1 Tax=Mesorhizobium sp. IMUNJ 23232 TaxID=3376064 RepID=UPI0037984EDE
MVDGSGVVPQRFLVGSWSWDVSGNRVYADGGVSACFGLTQEDGVRGVPVERYLHAIHEDDRDCVRHAIDETLAGRRDYNETYRLTPSYDGIRTIQALGRCSRVRSTNRPTIYFGHIIDLHRVPTGSVVDDDLRRHVISAISLARTGGRDLMAHLLEMALEDMSFDGKERTDRPWRQH